MAKVLAEAVTLLVAPEPAFAIQPETGWVQLQPNPGGIQDYAPQFQTVERDPLSKLATLEKGDNVGFDATPKFVCDWTKDLLDVIATAVFRSVAKHAGNTGLSRFRPTAVTATGYSVPALGNLAPGTLLFANGFPARANNGPKIVEAGSTADEIKVAGLVVESVDPTLGATVEVAGVQGAPGDIRINLSGNLTSTTLDFTALGLNVGQFLKLGGSAPITRFTTAAYNGTAKIVSIAPNLIGLERRTWIVGAADDGAGKTIELRFSRWYRNVPLDHPDYVEPTLHSELEELGPGLGGASTYTYGEGLGLKTLELDAPLESKIVATLTFCARDIRDPVLAAQRAPGAVSARRPMAAALFHTASPHLMRVRLATAATGDALAAEVNSWKFTMEHNAKPRDIQGERGAVDLIFGKIQPSLSMEVYYTSDEIPKALRDNRDVWFDVQVRNRDAAWILDLPNVGVRGGARTYAANEAVMCSLEVPAFRDPTSNIVASLSVFAHLPE